MHEEELDVVDVADEEGLVAGGHHVAGLLVGTIADLDGGKIMSAVVPRFPNRESQQIPIPIVVLQFPPGPSTRQDPRKTEPRTEGIARLLLKRLRTRLSIPLGLRHAAPTRIKRSLWWRMKPFVPVN